MRRALKLVIAAAVILLAHEAAQTRAWAGPPKIDVATKAAADAMLNETPRQRDQRMAWWREAKFGMFIDYGLYSVAGYAPKKETGPMYPDWYLYNMYHEPEVVQYHKAKWGDDFQRDDFIPSATAARLQELHGLQCCLMRLK